MEEGPEGGFTREAEVHTLLEVFNKDHSSVPAAKRWAHLELNSDTWGCNMLNKQQAPVNRMKTVSESGPGKVFHFNRGVQQTPFICYNFQKIHNENKDKQPTIYRGSTYHLWQPRAKITNIELLTYD